MREIVRIIRKDELGELLSLYRYLNDEGPVITHDDHLKAIWEEILQDLGQH